MGGEAHREALLCVWSPLGVGLGWDSALAPVGQEPGSFLCCSDVGVGECSHVSAWMNTRAGAG